jgi:hypothetical protein
MAAVSFVDKFIKSGNIPIHLVRCKDGKNRDCYYFLMAAFDHIKMLENVQKGMFNLNDYGKIIASGYGTEPSAEIKAMLLEKYSFNADTLK